jgi:hypothetical protein
MDMFRVLFVYISLPIFLCVALAALVSGCAAPRHSKVSSVRILGGSSADYATDVAISSSGAYAIVGNSRSADYDFVSLNKGYDDIIIIGLDSKGHVKWKTNLGGRLADFGTNIAATPDGGWVVVGYTRSIDGDFMRPSRKSADVIAAKIDANGRPVWKKAFGGSGDDIALAVSVDQEGSILVTGNTSSKNGDFENTKGDTSNFFAMKLSSTGDKVWTKVYGGTSIEEAYSAASAGSGEWLIAGYSSSADGDFDQPHSWGRDAFVMTLDSTGAKKSIKMIGGGSDDVAAAIVATSDGGYIVAGSAQSEDVAGYDPRSRNLNNIFVSRYDARGVLLWERNFEGATVSSLSLAPNGDIFFTGIDKFYRSEPRRMVLVMDDFFVRKIDSSGGNIWRVSYGGTDTDFATSIVVAPDGGCLLVGHTASDDGLFDRSAFGGQDVFVLKVDVNGKITPPPSSYK